MSDKTTTDTTTTAPQAAEADTAAQPDPADTTESTESQEDGKGKAGREAANYRRKLRETEAERDALAASVDALQRQLVAGSMPQGSTLKHDALWSMGRTPGEFFTKAGELDTAALSTAVRETHATLGVRFGADPIHEQGQRGEGGASGPSWGEALRARR